MSVDADSRLVVGCQKGWVRARERAWCQLMCRSGLNAVKGKGLQRQIELSYANPTKYVQACGGVATVPPSPGL